MKKYLIIVHHANYDELWATTNDYETAVKFAKEAETANEGELVEIKK